MNSLLQRTPFDDDYPCPKLQPLTVAAAIVTAGVAGAGAAAYSADKAANSADKMIDQEAKSAESAKDLGVQQLDWNKQQYYADKPLRDEASQASIGLMRQQAEAAAKQQDLADEYADYNRTTFRPLEQKIVADAQGYDTPERRAAVAASAAADVESAFGSSMSSLNRSLGRSGAVPGGGRSLSLMQDAALAKAGALAGATTGATRNVETVGAARMADAANLGRNLPSAQATAAATGINAGTSATAAGTAAINQSAAGLNAVNAGYSGAISSTLGAGSLYGQGAGLYMKQAAMYGDMAGSALKGVGSFLGTPAGQAWIASDKTKKKGTGKKADTKRALAEIKATPVEDGWQYDPEKGGPDDGGRRHIGPMAQAVRDHMGEDAAPGGEVIDLVNMNGRLMAGMQELARRTERLERQGGVSESRPVVSMRELNKRSRRVGQRTA